MTFHLGEIVRAKSVTSEDWFEGELVGIIFSPFAEHTVPVMECHMAQHGVEAGGLICVTPESCERVYA